MGRSSKRQRVDRINAALALLRQGQTPAPAARILSRRFAISPRQAYRYLEAAERTGEKLPMPRPRLAFTVKLSQGLIQRLRQYAQGTGQSLSEIVTQALEAFVPKGRSRGKKGKAPSSD